MYHNITRVFNLLKNRYILNKCKPSYIILKDGIKIPSMRGVDNNKCAIGFLIPDNLYNKKFEDLNIITILDRFPYVTEYLKSIGIFPYLEKYKEIFKEFLYCVQQWHDITLFNDASEENVIESLRHIEDKWQLLSISIQ